MSQDLPPLLTVPDFSTLPVGIFALGEFALVEHVVLWSVDLEELPRTVKRTKTEHKMEDEPAWWVMEEQRTVRSQVAGMDPWLGKRGTWVRMWQEHNHVQMTLHFDCTVAAVRAAVEASTLVVPGLMQLLE